MIHINLTLSIDTDYFAFERFADWKKSNCTKNRKNAIQNQSITDNIATRFANHS